MLVRHLELSRILKKLTHTKTAIESMLMPDEQGLRKANKKLFPVCSAMEEFSDSSSGEEQMLAIALENAQRKPIEESFARAESSVIETNEMDLLQKDVE